MGSRFRGNDGGGFGVLCTADWCSTPQPWLSPLLGELLLFSDKSNQKPVLRHGAHPAAPNGSPSCSARIGVAHNSPRCAGLKQGARPDPIRTCARRRHASRGWALTGLLMVREPNPVYPAEHRRSWCPINEWVAGVAGRGRDAEASIVRPRRACRWTPTTPRSAGYPRSGPDTPGCLLLPTFLGSARKVGRPSKGRNQRLRRTAPTSGAPRSPIL